MVELFVFNEEVMSLEGCARTMPYHEPDRLPALQRFKEKSNQLENRPVDQDTAEKIETLKAVIDHLQAGQQNPR